MADKAAAADQTSLEEAEAAATAAAAAEGDQLVADISRRCQELMEEKRRGLGIEMEGSFKARMSSVQNRYNSEKRRSITMWQTDILRMNKVFRDIARHLGSEWRPVFNILLQPLELTEAEVDMERRKVEKQKPFMQAYKALLTWKDLKDERGEDFDMLQLVEALKKVDKYELAEKTLDIMDSE